MTAQRSFKRLVRSRMEKTGESYTTARLRLLQGGDEPQQPTVLAAPDETIRERTGRGWEEWFDLLDEAGAADMTHRETARWLADREGLHPLAWNVQAVVGGYDKARRGVALAGLVHPRADETLEGSLCRHRVLLSRRRLRDSRSRGPTGKGQISDRRPEGLSLLCPRRAGGVSTGIEGWARDGARGQDTPVAGFEQPCARS